MLISILYDFDFGIRRLHAGDHVDIDQVIAQRWINDGIAVASNTSASVISWGTGAGSSGTPTAGSVGLSADRRMLIISVTPSATPGGSATLGVFGFSDAYGIAPTPVVLPLNHAANGVQGSALGSVIASAQTDRVTLTTGSALTAGTPYQFGILLS
jgi:hypothetical protein